MGLIAAALVKQTQLMNFSGQNNPIQSLETAKSLDTHSLREIDTESPTYRKNQLQMAFNSPFDRTESQIKSPAMLKLQDVLRVDLGSLLVFTSPYRAGKSYTLKDLTVHLRRNYTFAKYIDGRSADASLSAAEFVYGSLLLTKDAAHEDLGPFFQFQGEKTRLLSSLIILKI
jgi:hypothetical protein